MALIDGLAASAERLVGPVVGRFFHRRHRLALRRGEVSAADRERAAHSWWGDDTRWYAGGTPPREHNRITPLVDGESYFGAVLEALGSARSYVYIIGWSLTPHIPLSRRSREDVVNSRLLSVLNDVAQRVPVRILLWEGAPFLLQPTHATTHEVLRTIESESSGDLICRLDGSAHFSHCHHQKAIVVDGQIAFVGGMDLTTYQGDRWDTREHPLRDHVNWHDAQLKLEGEAVADVEHNFRQRWQAVTGDATLPHRDPAFDEAWQVPAQVIRTMPHHTYDFARHGEYGIHHAYTEAIRSAQKLIYVENQYLWSPHVMDALTEVMDNRDPRSFRIVIVLPARATSGKWDNDQHVKALRKADKGRGIVSVYSLYKSGPSAGTRPFRYRPVYLHAKVAVIDDEWLTVGSANLNNRGLITDGEMNVAVRDAALAKELRVDLWAEHLGLSRDEVASVDPLALIDTVWRDRAAENAAILKRGDGPLPCSVHSYEMGWTPAARALDEAESLTFEH
jgi:phosphatidylserine/phosphatidylglycerophosphate/cardiolipin synthase-like enzyme